MTSRFWSRIIVVCTAASLFGQTHDRLAARIDSRLTVTLESSVDPRIKDLIDGGPVDPHEPVRGISFRFRPSPEQSAALQQLLEDQQNPDSPRYHDWLTPEQFADQFGLSDADYGRVREWIESEGFQIDATARSRTYIVFSGTAAQVQGTFGAELHRYSGHGETHLASATAARLPADLAPLVYGIRGLDDFKARASGRAKPRFIDAGNGSNGLGPGDLAVIYDINPLYQKGLDGTGQKIAVVGQSELHVSDVQLFRDEFKLPANDPHLILVPGYPDPGIVEKDFDEANADVQFAGMAAPKASVYYVYSQHVYYSEQYAVDQNIAPVISDSYGLCEKVVLAQPQFADLNRSMVQQANAQGITWIGITGDTGPAGCEYQTTDTAGLNGFSTRMIGSVPEVTAVGGTRFNEGSGNYWSADQAAGHVSALSYIPEVVWNDTAHDGTLAASGGGASIFFPKPAWQTGPGVPNDNRRHVPDIAFAASWDHDYYVFAEKGTFWFYGGTSSAAPFFAGAVALLNQYLVAGGYQSRPGLGNINPKLYQLAQTTSGVFHDITSGDTIIPCKIGTPDCTTGSYGFRAGPGYDEATGLGSIDIYNLFLAWTGTSSTPHTVVTTLTASANPVQISENGSTILTATVKASTGSQSPNGSVTFSLGPSSLGTATLQDSGGSATASISISGRQLAPGVNNIAMSYPGSSSFSSSSGAVSVTVPNSTSPGAASMVLTSAPSIVVKNAKPDPSCNANHPLYQALNLVERNGYEVRLTKFIAAGNDWSDQIANWFGSLRLAPYGSLSTAVCWQFDHVPGTYHFEVQGVDQAGHTITAPLDVLTKVAGQPAGTLSVSKPSLVLFGSPGSALDNFHIDVPSTENWSISVLPANPRSRWLSFSALAGKGPGSIDVIADASQLEKGVYNVTVTVECTYCIPAFVNVDVVLVVGHSDTTKIQGLQNAASFQDAFAPGMLMSIYGNQLANTTEAAHTSTLPLSLGGVSATVNGVPAPLWFVSPGQINLQIPYETAAGRAIVAVNNNGQVSGASFTMSATAPGIFTNSGLLTPSASASRGSAVSMYVTGDGELSPMIDTGAPPPADTPVSGLPKPRAQVRVTVGGVPATVVFVGNPWLVGITQINFTVPPAVPAGPQPVVVTVGAVSSAPATLNVR